MRQGVPEERHPGVHYRPVVVDAPEQLTEWLRSSEAVEDDRVAKLLRDGQAAARAGHRAKARRQIRTALFFDPTNVTALLWLAWLSDDPRASLAHIARVLACDPYNPHAQEALRWARQRARAYSPSPSGPLPSSKAARRPSRHRSARPVVAAAALLLVALIGGIVVGSAVSDLPVLAALVPSPFPVTSAVVAAPATASATATATATVADTKIPSSGSAQTLTGPETATSTAAATATRTPTHTPTLMLRPPLPTPLPYPPVNTLVPPAADSGLRWIDVDLTNQALTAYVGRTPVRITAVSTGLPRTPTPVGMFRIYLKLRYDDMRGPDYYLRSVPYTMYFHRGYGLHGTYWHSNFGRPMSHGCVNLPTAEAKWLFNWADVGTLVMIHD